MSQNRRNWAEFQDKAIVALVKKYGVKNWVQISEMLSTKYGIENRTGKQCRERWHNHLDPEVNKNDWTYKEEKIMFEAHQKYGNKWTEIAKLFQGRTDNDIKNHFYSMLRRSLRRVNKILGIRNSTQKIKVIKPSVLSKIFTNKGTENEQKIQQTKKIAEALFEFSKSKAMNDISSNLKEEERKRLEELIQKLAQYNQQYQTTLKFKKSGRSSSKNQDKQDKAPTLCQPVIIKKASNISVSSKEAEKKGSQTKVIAQSQPNQQICSQQQQPKKVQKQGPNKKESQVQINVQSNQGPVGPITRLRKKQTQYPAFSIGDEFMLPDICELPSLSEAQKRSSIVQLKKINSNSSGYNFYLNASPRMDPRMLTRTPPGPTPNLSQAFCRNLTSYQCKTNNEELDRIVSQTRNNIQKNTRKR